jgi:hypothetical protein
MTEVSLATSSLVRPTGRIRRYRSVPVAASPAMESPATTATATGRKTGSTSASAAAGYSAPSASTADRNAAPWPGGGVRWVIAMKMATTNGSAQVRTRLIHVRGRRASLMSSTPITAYPRSGPTRCR